MVPITNSLLCCVEVIGVGLMCCNVLSCIHLPIGVVALIVERIFFCIDGGVICVDVRSVGLSWLSSGDKCCCGLLAALGPFQHFSGGWFVLWQYSQVEHVLGVKLFTFWVVYCFCSCSFIILVRHSLIKWPIFSQWRYDALERSGLFSLTLVIAIVIVGMVNSWSSFCN